MSFDGDIARFRDKVRERGQDLHNRVCDLAFSSIVEGSELTGAPGQPVQTGALKGSWQNVIDGPLERRIVTNLVYAPQIEDGSRDGRELTLRSPVGGFHSVALTRAGWERIVERATAEITGEAGA